MSKEIEQLSCKSCGGSSFYKKSGACTSCAKAACRKYYQANKARLKKKANKYYLENKEVALSRVRLYRSTASGSVRRTNQKYYKANKDNRLAYIKQWRKANPDKVIFYSGLRRSKINNATPSWLSASDKATIFGFYVMAKRLTSCLGIKYHVDHIYPLKGKTSCGLHVPWNLQVIPECINLSKNNRNPEEFYHE